MIELFLILAGAGAWSHYGGDEGGSRYVVADQVDRANVGSLEVAWEFHSGDMADKPEAICARSTSKPDTNCGRRSYPQAARQRR